MTKFNKYIAKKVKEDNSRSPLVIITTIVLILYVLLLVILMVWAVYSSMKDAYEFDDSALKFPSVWTFQNYINVLNNFTVRVTNASGIHFIGMPMMYLNSIIYSVGGSFVSLVAITITAYAVACFPCKLSKAIEVTILITMMIPLVGSEASMIVLLHKFHIFDTWAAPLFMKFGFTGMYTLVVINSFRALPPSLTEAAKIDGASLFTVMMRIHLPMVKGILFTVFLLNFVVLWNDYQMPLLYIPSHPTISYGVWFTSQNNVSELSNIPSRLASSVLLLVPVLLVFIVFRKRIMGQDLTIGGSKE